jgi:hypothetical protein
MTLAMKNARFYFIQKILGEHLFYEGSSSAKNKFHEKNILNVSKKHVYNVQNFTTNRKLLWRHIEVRLQLNRANNLINKKKYISALMVFCIIFCKNPITGADQMLFKLKRKLK